MRASLAVATAQKPSAKAQTETKKENGLVDFIFCSHGLNLPFPACKLIRERASRFIVEAARCGDLALPRGGIERRGAETGALPDPLKN